MKYTFAFFLGLLVSSQCPAQLGFLAGYKTFRAPGWDESFGSVVNESLYSNSTWQVGVDYWFRLKKRRIEFAPELSYARFNNFFVDGEAKLNQIGFHFNTSIYLFDLASDCNCPTFSKDGNAFGKGFFLEVSPGVTFLKSGFSGEIASQFYYPEKSLAFGGSIGAGLDIGISDLFTITPLARYYYYPSLDTVDELSPAGIEPTALVQLFAGLRFRLHFKELAKARFR